MNIMKIRLFLISLLVALFSACEKSEMPGISSDEVLKQEVIGGWEVKDIRCYIKLPALLSPLQKSMQENLERRALNTSLYITTDSIFFIKTHETGYKYVKSSSAYEVVDNPARIVVENERLLSGEYAPYYFVKKEDGRLCLYLTRQEALRLIEKDGTFDGFMGTVEKTLEDAQFEFYLDRNDLEIYKDIDNGSFVHTEDYSKY